MSMGHSRGDRSPPGGGPWSVVVSSRRSEISSRSVSSKVPAPKVWENLANPAPSACSQAECGHTHARTRTNGTPSPVRESSTSTSRGPDHSGALPESRGGAATLEDPGSGARGSSMSGSDAGLPAGATSSCGAGRTEGVVSSALATRSRGPDRLHHATPPHTSRARSPRAARGTRGMPCRVVAPRDASTPRGWDWAGYGPTPNSTASDRLVVWLLVLAGSRYQSWAWTVAPAPGFFCG